MKEILRLLDQSRRQVVAAQTKEGLERVTLLTLAGSSLEWALTELRVAVGDMYSGEVQ